MVEGEIQEKDEKCRNTSSPCIPMCYNAHQLTTNFVMFTGWFINYNEFLSFVIASIETTKN